MKKNALSAALALSTLSYFPIHSQAKSMQTQTLSLSQSIEKLEKSMEQQLSPKDHKRLSEGLKACAALWRHEDGNAEAFEAFVKQFFATDQASLDALYKRLSFVIESLDGHMLELTRDLRWYGELDLDTPIALDEILQGWDPSAHIQDDAFTNKMAFLVLLNFPPTDLETRLKEGDGWSRRQWAESRLSDRYSKRVPAYVNQAVAKASGDAERYIASYNIWAHHLLNEKGERIFPAGKRLLSHWNLRDEIKSQYPEGKTGLERQRMLQKVMEHITHQSIPQSVVDNPLLDWKPYTNQVAVSPVKDHDRSEKIDKADSSPEGTARYERILACYQAIRQADPYNPKNPTHILRSFHEGRQLPEQRVQGMFESILTSPLVKDVCKLMEKRIGRPLEPFDIWYQGFKPKSTHSEAQLDEITRKRFPDAASFKTQLPKLLQDIGFTHEKAQFLASKIDVDPARGSGHAMGAERKSDNAHLRTRVGKAGMDYKGFNIAVHELGHNVEQVFSLNGMDEFFLKGVPNTAFTEAIAFVFQARDLELLGLSRPSPQDQAWNTLQAFWSTFEIAAVALVDMQVWRWMYEHPNATPADLKDATLKIAKETWNRYCLPVLGQKDCSLLAVYSHMVSSFLYLPDYPVGHIIANQIEMHLGKSGNLGQEVERITRLGRLTPDLWMKQATGKPVGTEAMLEGTAIALKNLKKD